MLAAVFAGGGAGAVVRAGLADTFATGAGWPWVTFAVNLAGAFLLGAVLAATRARPAGPPYCRPLLGTGFCGALTTFSTLQLEVLRMLDHGRPGLAAGYVLASVALGLAAATAGGALGGRAAAAGARL